MIKKRIFLAVCCIFMIAIAIGQHGGDHTYSFMNIPKNAYSSSMGGSNVSVRSSDVNLVSDNPALIDSNMSNSISLNYMNYYAGINMGYAAYARKFRKIGTIVWGLQYLNYGQFTYTDVTGNELGTFTAGDYALLAGYSHPVFIDSLFQVGGNLKVIYSTLEQYKSSAIAADLGANYQSKNKNFSVGLVMKNIGRQITTYTGNNRESLPFDLQMGISKRMGHAPLRLTLLTHHLHIWDLTYHDPKENPVKTDPVTGEEIDKTFTFDKLMRHIILGGEFMPTKNVSVRASYNHQRKKEMTISGRKGMTGISLGFGIKIYKFRLDYSRAVYHIAGASNHISITTNINDLVKSKKLTTGTSNAP